MNRRLGSIFVIAAAFLLLECSPAEESGGETATAAAPAGEVQAGPSIEGTYRLAYRELPDGTRVDPPAVEGLITFTSEYRNFNVMWIEEDGSEFTMGVVSRYTLTDTEYTEELVYRVTVGPEEGGAMFEGAGSTGSAGVTLADDQISFALPLDDVNASFAADAMTATREGAFVDYWERVD
jgi:hypothetical protein